MLGTNSVDQQPESQPHRAGTRLSRQVIRQWGRHAPEELNARLPADALGSIVFIATWPLAE